MLTSIMLHFHGIVVREENRRTFTRLVPRLNKPVRNRKTTTQNSTRRNLSSPSHTRIPKPPDFKTNSRNCRPYT